MGAARGPKGASVRLHIYSATRNPYIGKANELLYYLGTGIFHSSVEVYAREWGFGANFVPGTSGIYQSKPGADPQHVHREVIELGPTALSEAEVNTLLDRLHEEWLGTEYDLLGHNCSHFTAAFCEGLGVGPMPAWVTSLAAFGVEAEAVAQVAVGLGGDFLQHLRCWDSFMSLHGPDLGSDCRRRVARNLQHFRANYLLVTCVFLVLVLLGRPLQLFLALAAALGLLLAMRHAPTDAEAAGNYTLALTGVSAVFSLLVLREALVFCGVMTLLHAMSHPGHAEATEAGLAEKKRDL